MIYKIYTVRDTRSKYFVDPMLESLLTSSSKLDIEVVSMSPAVLLLCFHFTSSVSSPKKYSLSRCLDEFDIRLQTLFADDVGNSSW